MFLWLRELREAAYLKRWSSWDEKDEEILIQILMSDLENHLSDKPHTGIRTFNYISRFV
jgi:hypothetical protein